MNFGTLLLLITNRILLFEYCLWIGVSYSLKNFKGDLFKGQFQNSIKIIWVTLFQNP